MMNLLSENYKYILDGGLHILYFLMALVIFFTIKDYYKRLLKESGELLNDTLKINGKYSRTSITMFSSFLIGTLYSMYALVKTGFDFQVFLVYMLVATGIKITDAYSKKIVGDVKPEKPQEIKVEIKQENNNEEVG